MRVALIRADQKIHPVVIPQRPCNTTQISKDGKVEKINPPTEVITRAWNRVTAAKIAYVGQSVCVRWKTGGVVSAGA